MQISPLKEIEKLRGEKDLKVFQRNQNKHAIILCEDRSLTAYYFSTPIYNSTDKTLVQLMFSSAEKDVFLHRGSHAGIKVTSTGAVLSNELGRIRLFFEKQAFSLKEHCLCSPDMQILPTLNGIAVRARTRGEFSVRIQTENAYEIRSNTKYAAFMQEKFIPFAVFGVLPGTAGRSLIPVQMEIQKIDDRNYRIFIFSTTAEEIFFELNLYEGKLFQDTTVESYKDYENNAFGPVMFLGNTEEFGQQWFYSRLDFSRLSGLENETIHRIRLHIPVCGQAPAQIAAYPLMQRFCSFGSAWNNKIQPSLKKINGSFLNGYQSFELTDLMTTLDGGIKRTEGLVLKNDGPGYAVMATGDNYYTPQILEVNYAFDRGKWAVVP